MDTKQLFIACSHYTGLMTWVKGEAVLFIREELPAVNLTLCDTQFTKMMVFDHIGVLKYGIRHEIR